MRTDRRGFLGRGLGGLLAALGLRRRPAEAAGLDLDTIRASAAPLRLPPAAPARLPRGLEPGDPVWIKPDGSLWFGDPVEPPAMIDGGAVKLDAAEVVRARMGPDAVAVVERMAGCAVAVVVGPDSGGGLFGNVLVGWGTFADDVSGLVAWPSEPADPRPDPGSGWSGHCSTAVEELAPLPVARKLSRKLSAVFRAAGDWATSPDECIVRFALLAEDVEGIGPVCRICLHVKRADDRKFIRPAPATT